MVIQLEAKQVRLIKYACYQLMQDTTKRAWACWDKNRRHAELLYDVAADYGKICDALEDADND